jgi:hypothetical protein
MSDRATHCPSCGATVHSITRESGGRWSLGCGTGSPTSRPRPSSRREETTRERDDMRPRCIDARRHKDSCESEQCRGCAPRRASQGILCESCHLILVDILHNIPGQIALLRASVEPTRTPTPSPQPTHGKVGPRLSTSTPHYIAAARASMTVVESEAIRLACLDVAREIEDALSAIVEALCKDYQQRGPARLQTAADREDPARVALAPGVAGR